MAALGRNDWRLSAFGGAFRGNKLGVTVRWGGELRRPMSFSVDDQEDGVSGGGRGEEREGESF